MMVQKNKTKRVANFLRDAVAVRGQLTDYYSLEARKQQKDIVCARGCHGCCLQLLMLSAAEAFDILIYLAAHNRLTPIFWSGVAALAVRERLVGSGGPLVRGLTVYRRSDIRCLFLDQNNDCTVYPVRPLACAIYHSIGVSADPCYAHDQRVEVFNIQGPRVVMEDYMTKTHRQLKIGRRMGFGLCSALLAVGREMRRTMPRLINQKLLPI